MTKKINEAHARLDLSGLESDDLQTLSEILRLAGQSEEPSSDVGVMGVDTSVDMPVQVEPLLPQSEPSIDSISTDALPQEPMQSELDMMGDEFDVQPEMNDGFDVDELASLSGIDDEPDMIDVQDDMFEAFLPDTLLDESPSELFGPFSTEREAVQDASVKTNGVENEHFTVSARGNKFYWERVIKEDIDHRPEPEETNTDGIINSRHAVQPKKTGLGDNRMKMPVRESEKLGADEELDEGAEGRTESIFESIKERFNKFMGE